MKLNFNKNGRIKKGSILQFFSLSNSTLIIKNKKNVKSESLMKKYWLNFKHGFPYDVLTIYLNDDEIRQIAKILKITARVYGIGFSELTNLAILDFFEIYI